MLQINGMQNKIQSGEAVVVCLPLEHNEVNIKDRTVLRELREYVDLYHRIPLLSFPLSLRINGEGG